MVYCFCISYILWSNLFVAVKKESSSKSEKLREKNDTEQTDDDTEDFGVKADQTDSKNS